MSFIEIHSQQGLRLGIAAVFFSLICTSCSLPPPATTTAAPLPSQQPSALPAHTTADIEAAIHHHNTAINCMTCHAGKKPDYSITDGSGLDQFHQGLTFNHGQLSCLSCHNTENYETFRRADGRQIAWNASMDLCKQCHGPQYRDYQHGAHGGMSGFWDTSRGPQQRNDCTACHDPHSPAFGLFKPLPPPQDTAGLGALHE